MLQGLNVFIEGVALTIVCIYVHQSGGGSPQSQRPAELSDDEVGELFQRLAEVQQEKWMLEEKVSNCYCDNHLCLTR